MPYKITAPTGFTGLRAGDERPEWLGGTCFVPDDRAGDLAYYRQTGVYQVEHVDTVDPDWAEGIARLRARREHHVGTAWIDSADVDRIEPRADLLSRLRAADPSTDYSAAAAAIISEIEGTN